MTNAELRALAARVKTEEPSLDLEAELFAVGFDPMCLTQDGVAHENIPDGWMVAAVTLLNETISVTLLNPKADEPLVRATSNDLCRSLTMASILAMASQTTQ